MDAIECKARELFAQWHADRGCSERILDDCRSGVISPDQLTCELLRMALAPPEGFVLVPTRVLEDAHSFVRDKIHWEGGDRRLLNALSELVKLPSA